MKSKRVWWFCAVLSVLLAVPTAAEDSVDFNSDIRPILANRCFTCHGPDVAQREAELRLDTFAGASEDRGGYQAIAPGNPGKSELLRRVQETGDERMPPAESGKPLSAKEISLLKQWIASGAKYARHWSLEPPVKSQLPEIKDSDRVRNEIDHFVLNRLEKQERRLSNSADRYTLIRRLSLDLTGLPPTAEEVERFINDKDPKAYENLVERLFASSAYGERWAAMWLDLARYADSAGYANDPPRTIWMYRDWVIRAFNQNMPFDQFTIEQLAGDMLENATDSQRIATAFHRNTLTNSEGGTNDEEFRNVAIVDRLNTTMQVWMGVTIGCAQCHNHKYDPISQEEYFRLFAFFNNSADSDRADESPLLRTFSEDQTARRNTLENEINAIKEKLTPSDDEIGKQLARFVEEYREPEWRALRPKNAVATGGSKLAVQDDLSIIASGLIPDKSVYELEFASDGKPITAIRIEAIAGEAPDEGYGRTGNFVLSELIAAAGAEDARSRRGRYVRVELPGKNKFLHLAEVEVFSDGANVARMGKASQNSTDFNGPAKLAIDGNTNGLYDKGSVSHTAAGDDPWWEVDLGSDVDVDRIVVWNRTDNNLQSRLDGYRITLFDAEREVVWSKTYAKAPQREQLAEVGGLTPIVFRRASESYAQTASSGIPYKAWTAAAAIDGDAKGVAWGWAVGGAPKGSQNAAFEFAKPLAFHAGAKLKLLLNQNFGSGALLRRFRIYASSDSPPVTILPNAVQAALAVDAKSRTDTQTQALVDYLKSIHQPPKTLTDKIASLQKQLDGVKPISTPIMEELPEGKRRVTKIQIRGNFMVTTDTVTEGTPKVLHRFPDGAPSNRLGLARWLVDRQNPLTARVVVNRYWEQIFGVGIVATGEEFGTQGELPSHPRLLDWLAVDFMESGWDLQHLLRKIVLSATYRQSSAASAELLALDPANRLMARGPRFRLPAEMIRDQSLAVSGLLSDKMYGPSVRPPRPKLGLRAAFGGSTDWEASTGEDRYRRALYTSWRRSIPYPSMATFDAPTRNVCTINRGRTNTPLQALVTLNDPAFVEAAQALARRVYESDDDMHSKVKQAFLRTTGRPPSASETRSLVNLFELAKAQLAKQPEEAKQLATEPLGPVDEETDFVQLAAWTAVANVLLNLDEVLVKD